MVEPGHFSMARLSCSCVSSGGAPTPLVHRCSLCENFTHTHIKCEVKIMGYGDGASMAKWVGQLVILGGDMLKITVQFMIACSNNWTVGRPGNEASYLAFEF